MPKYAECTGSNARASATAKDSRRGGDEATRCARLLSWYFRVFCFQFTRGSRNCCETETRRGEPTPPPQACSTLFSAASSFPCASFAKAESIPLLSTFSTSLTGKMALSRVAVLALAAARVAASGHRQNDFSPCEAFIPGNWSCPACSPPALYGGQWNASAGPGAFSVRHTSFSVAHPRTRHISPSRSSLLFRKMPAGLRCRGALGVY